MLYRHLLGLMAACTAASAQNATSTLLGAPIGSAGTTGTIPTTSSAGGGIYPNVTASGAPSVTIITSIYQTLCPITVVEPCSTGLTTYVTEGYSTVTSVLTVTVACERCGSHGSTNPPHAPVPAPTLTHGCNGSDCVAESGSNTGCSGDKCVAPTKPEHSCSGNSCHEANPDTGSGEEEPNTPCSGSGCSNPSAVPSDGTSPTTSGSPTATETIAEDTCTGGTCTHPTSLPFLGMASSGDIPVVVLGLGMLVGLLT